MTKAVTTWKSETAKINASVAFIDGAKTIRAFDAVVYSLDQFTPGARHRTVVVKTNQLNRAFDAARLQRMSRRLKAIGYRFTTSLTDSRGTVFAYRLS